MDRRLMNKNVNFGLTFKRVFFNANRWLSLKNVKLIVAVVLTNKNNNHHFWVFTDKHFRHFMNIFLIVTVTWFKVYVFIL